MYFKLMYLIIKHSMGWLVNLANQSTVAMTDISVRVTEVTVPQGMLMCFYFTLSYAIIIYWSTKLLLASNKGVLLHT